MGVESLWQFKLVKSATHRGTFPILFFAILQFRVSKEKRPLVRSRSARGIRQGGGHTWIRTMDLYDINPVRYAFIKADLDGGWYWIRTSDLYDVNVAL